MHRRPESVGKLTNTPARCALLSSQEIMSGSVGRSCNPWTDESNFPNSENEIPHLDELKFPFTCLAEQLPWPYADSRSQRTAFPGSPAKQSHFFADWSATTNENGFNRASRSMKNMSALRSRGW